MLNRLKYLVVVLLMMGMAGSAFHVGGAFSTLFTWSQTASSNSTADATINWAEGQAPGTVNDSARAMMAAVAKYRDDLSGSLNTAGTSTAYTLTTNQIFTSLTDGLQVAFRLDEANGAAPTLNVDSLGAKGLRLVSAANLVGNELSAGAIYLATYDSGGDEWLISGSAATQQVPAGTVADFAGSSAPTGWLLMFGQCVSRTTYAGLFAVIGTTYDNSCSGSDFGIPDARGRVAAGQDDMGSVSANRLTGQTNGVDGDVLGGVGGVETNTIAQANLPNVNFGVTDPGHVHAGGDASDQTRQRGTVSDTSWAGNPRNTSSANTGITVNSGGSGTALNNVQPTLILNKIIKQ